MRFINLAEGQNNAGLNRIERLVSFRLVPWAKLSTIISMVVLCCQGPRLLFPSGVVPLSTGLKIKKGENVPSFQSTAYASIQLTSMVTWPLSVCTDSHTHLQFVLHTGSGLSVSLMPLDPVYTSKVERCGHYQKGMCPVMVRDFQHWRKKVQMIVEDHYLSLPCVFFIPSKDRPC